MKHRFYIPVGLIEHNRLQEMVFNYHKPSLSLYYKYVYVLHYLCWYRSIYGETYETYGVPVNAEVLYDIIGREHKAEIFEKLEEWGLVELVRKHKASEWSRHYMLTEILAEEPLSIVTLNVKETPIVGKLKEKQRNHLCTERLLKKQLDILKNNISLSSTALQWIQRRYNNADVDSLIAAYGQSSATLDELLLKVKVEQEDIMLFAFVLKDFFTPTRPRKDSRIYTSLTSLKREYRQFLLLSESAKVCFHFVFEPEVLGQYSCQQECLFWG